MSRRRCRSHDNEGGGGRFGGETTGVRGRPPSHGGRHVVESAVSLSPVPVMISRGSGSTTALWFHNSGHGRRRHPEPSRTVATDLAEIIFTRQRVSDVATGRSRSADAETWMDSDSESEQSLNIGTCPDSQGDRPSLGR